MLTPVVYLMSATLEPLGDNLDASFYIEDSHLVHSGLSTAIAYLDIDIGRQLSADLLTRGTNADYD